MSTKTYRQKILEWRTERDAGIRRENSWLALAGLFWLKPGRNEAGSDPACEILLPRRAPAHLGYFDCSGQAVSFHAAGGSQILVNDRPADSPLLQPDVTENPSFITLDDIRLVVIQRGGKLGVRIWDNQREERRSFPALTWFEIDGKYCIPAHYTAYAETRMGIFPDVNGEDSELPLDGYAAFQFEGREYRLDGSREKDGSLFIRFRDPTGRTETYPAGRYLTAEIDTEGRLELDFNRAFNPPCSVTGFATCVFAPEQNHLDFKVAAGEKYKRHRD